ncbi:MAG TPA: RNA-protein complex protein Nop10 [Pyrodictium delaneyi]|uniref:Ribosome biogenesis protein Nop10 n=1 Tax=Pyrodictium delaneyi TaxID=1273541 RepID=A0A832ZWA2_9CREN|nr:RNA-protein complex protein Nop10 [Pyrodictium delaneyi]
MRWLMRRCIVCGRYTLRRDKCPLCGGSVAVPHPPRFSPEDKYVAYRYKMKMLAGMINTSENAASTR